MNCHPVLIGGRWRASHATGSFQAVDPRTCRALPDEYPVSSWRDVDEALGQAMEAAEMLRHIPVATIGDFLDRFATRIESAADRICELAAAETALPLRPRLAEIELPRTTAQLRQAAAAARDMSWALPTIDARLNLRSYHAPIGPVCVFGPNNFPLAFNAVCGGDFAAAIAAGNPVLAKAHSAHPGTSRLLAEEAHQAAAETGMPSATVQLIYRLDHADGLRMVADPRVGATGYTGSRNAGLALKAAADQAGKPIYLELSSINPVVILPGALCARSEAIADEFASSCLMGSGQFCTNPGLVLLLESPETDRFIEQAISRFRSAAPGTLLAPGVLDALAQSVSLLVKNSAQVLIGGSIAERDACRYANTLLSVSGAAFLSQPAALQTEAFGNASLLVLCRDTDQMACVVSTLEGNLTGTIYWSADGGDDEAIERIEPLLRKRVGRLIHNKMPTGVAVSPAMVHGGPYPATGHPGFTSVGIPASMRRFSMLQCFDNVRAVRLPAVLHDAPPRVGSGGWSMERGL